MGRAVNKKTVYLNSIFRLDPYSGLGHAEASEAEVSMHNEFSTGHEALDELLQGLRLGDNVVWRCQTLAHYGYWSQRFAQATQASGRTLIYCRFAAQPLPIAGMVRVEEVRLRPQQGFAAFTQQVWQLINDYGLGACYVFDPLTELLAHWHCDQLVTLFFQITCPRLYHLQTIAYFGMAADAHSQQSWQAIRSTTQLLVDQFDHQSCYLQPVKVWQRHSALMFLPHAWQDQHLTPVLHSAQASRLQARAAGPGHSRSLLDPWDRLFWLAEAALSSPESQHGPIKTQLIATFISNEPKQQALVARYFSLAELVALRKRLIGTGYIGGKALGMLLARQILAAKLDQQSLSYLDPHDSWYFASDNFYHFLQQTGLWPDYMALLGAPSDEQAAALQAKIKRQTLPSQLQALLLPLLDYYGQFPLLVRSSSLLEDGFAHAFAGKYASVFVVNQGGPEQRLLRLSAAIVEVYASCVSPEAMDYRTNHRLLALEEPMAILLQRVNGSYYGDWYCPPAALVAMSRNAFVWSDQMRPEGGMMRLVAGLGTRAVDRIAEDHAAVVALDAPELRPWNSLQQAADFCQRYLDVLSLTENELQTRSWLELLNLGLTLPKEWLAEPDWPAMQRAGEIGRPMQVWRLTFKALLRDSPLVSLLKRYLCILEQAYGQPVDTEFTLHLSGSELALNLVQCRPMSSYASAGAVDLPALASANIWLRSKGQFMGGSQHWPVDLVLQVLPEAFAGLSVQQRGLLCTLLRLWNQRIAADRSKAVLLGPGRWGSSSPDLGLPVTFADISAMSLLVEVADLGRGLVPDLSFGSHFFQDLVESGMAYLALFPTSSGHWQVDALTGYTPETHPDCEASRDPCIANALQVFQLQGQGWHVWMDLTGQALLCGHQ